MLGTEISCSKTEREIVRAGRCCERLGTPILRAGQSFHLSTALDKAPFSHLQFQHLRKVLIIAARGFSLSFCFLQRGKGGKKGPNNCSSTALIMAERLAEYL